MEYKWYVADIVLKINVEDDNRNLIHINTILIKGNMPDDAYSKAIRFGKEHEMRYKNTDEKEVEIKFIGLRNLIKIYEEVKYTSIDMLPAEEKKIYLLTGSTTTSGNSYTVVFWIIKLNDNGIRNYNTFPIVSFDGWAHNDDLPVIINECAIAFIIYYFQYYDDGVSFNKHYNTIEYYFIEGSIRDEVIGDMINGELHFSHGSFSDGGG